VALWAILWKFAPKDKLVVSPLLDDVGEKRQTQAGCAGVILMVIPS
jgi:hypothetical protein